MEQMREPWTEEVREHLYRFRLLDAFEQAFIVKRVAPIVAGLQAASLLPQDEKVAETMRVFGGIPDADLKFVMTLCLSRIDRKTDGGWVPLWNERAKAFQFQQLGLNIYMELVMMMVGKEIGPFWSELQSTLQELPQE